MSVRGISLDGIWDFVVDLDPRYHERHGGYHRPDLVRRHWQKVPVPGVWQKFGERYDLFEGVAWYAREFDVPPFSANATTVLRFGGINYLCQVFLNGEEIGWHEGGYTEFTIDATGKLRPGRNHIAIRVDNRSSTIKLPPVLGYFNYGGIHRKVVLELREGPCLDDIRLQAMPDDQGGRLLLKARVLSPCKDLKVQVESEGLCWEHPVAADGSITCEVPFFGAKLWSPEKPVLYPVHVRLIRGLQEEVDAADFNCGFRTLEVQGEELHLNGSRYFLKGICYVYDSPVSGLVMTREQIETDLRLIKEMGCNAVRCHYPMDTSFYEACDRLGLLVWIEVPVYCYHPEDAEQGTCFSDPAWIKLAQQMAREMIATARNHPSVVIYSIGNECNTQNAEAAFFFRHLAETIREEDPTRLVSYAALYGLIGAIADTVDIVGLNSYWGWYDVLAKESGMEARPAGGGCVERRPIDLSPMKRMLDEILEEKPVTPLLLTEFGADSVPGFYSQSRELWSENYHHDLLAAIFELTEEYPQIVGTFPFCFSDYRDPSKVPNGYWNELNLKGMVDYHRNRKLAWQAVQSFYRQER